ncbi:MAG: phage head morphogenesis protein [bacterium]|nr:phage head morphogenesis protein [bacterium]
MTVNDDFLDAAIRHALRLERFKSHEARAIVRLLRDEVYTNVLEEVRSRLLKIGERGFDLGPMTTRRLSNMSDAIRTITRAGYSTAWKRLSADMKKLALTEADWQARTFDRLIPFEWDVLTPSPETLRALVTTHPVRGTPLRKWFMALEPDTAGGVVRAIRAGLAEGQTVTQMARSVNEFLFTKRRHAVAVVRTAATHISATAREATYQENEDLVKGVQWLSTLDSRTTPVCMGRDQQVYKVGEGPRPPAHVQCRSTTTPVLKSWKDLGIDAKDVEPKMRAAMNGRVAASTTYGQWLKRQPKGVQVEALGKRRAELFRSGELSVDRFTDDRGKLLTLEKLAKD